MELKPGLRLESATDDTNVVVVKGKGEFDLRCGGAPMREIGQAVTALQRIPKATEPSSVSATPTRSSDSRCSAPKPATAHSPWATRRCS